MTLGLLSVANFKLRSKLSELKSEEDDSIQYWIDLADSLIESFDLDSSLPGFDINIAFAIQKTAESIYVQNLESNILVINSPYQSERVGSYSYTKARPRDDEGDIFLPSIALAIVLRYLSSSDTSSYTTSVFVETEPDKEGRREYHDYLNNVVDKYPGLFEKSSALW